MPRPPPQQTADIVVLKASDLARMFSELRRELLADMRKELAGTRAARPAAASPAEPARKAGQEARMVPSAELWRALGVSRAKWYRLLRQYPALAELRRGRRWPVEAVRIAVAALM